MKLVFYQIGKILLVVVFSGVVLFFVQIIYVVVLLVSQQLLMLIQGVVLNMLVIFDDLGSMVYVYVLDSLVNSCNNVYFVLNSYNLMYFDLNIQYKLLKKVIFFNGQIQVQDYFKFSFIVVWCNGFIQEGWVNFFCDYRLMVQYQGGLGVGIEFSIDWYGVFVFYY